MRCEYNGCEQYYTTMFDYRIVYDRQNNKFILESRANENVQFAETFKTLAELLQHIEKEVRQGRPWLYP
jgi:hypothetical protein